MPGRKKQTHRATGKEDFRMFQAYGFQLVVILTPGGCLVMSRDIFSSQS